MTFEEFSKIWDDTVESDSRHIKDLQDAEINPKVRAALIAYRKGDISLMEGLKKEFYEKSSLGKSKKLSRLER